MGALVPSRPLLPDLDAAAPPASAILSPASATRPNSERRLQGRLSSRADLELDRATRRRAARIPQDPQGQHREWEEATLPKIAGTVGNAAVAGLVEGTDSVADSRLRYAH